jgi:hypothetical protein
MSLRVAADHRAAAGRQKSGRPPQRLRRADVESLAGRGNSSDALTRPRRDVSDARSKEAAEIPVLLSCDEAPDLVDDEAVATT